VSDFIHCVRIPTVNSDDCFTVATTKLNETLKLKTFYTNLLHE